jgi:hypothetical protein
MSRFQRMSVAMSLFLFRKVLPSEQPSINSFLDKISQPSPEPDSEFLDFAGKLVDKMFPVGWDSGYDDEVEFGGVGTSSCEEGGVTRERYLHKYGEEAREVFLWKCLSDDAQFEPTRARMKNVYTAGKYRTISIPSVDHHHLRPLHNTIYNHLSKQGWLLRGDAVPRRFEGKCNPFQRADDEVFVSGDYEGATDNLNNHVQRFLLCRVLSRCLHVPFPIRNYAVDSLSPTLSFGEREVKLRSGQMMGFLVSFPLLCLVNYVTFKFFVRRKVPVKINGDDIVFRSSREEYERWAEGVSRSGLKLSVGKTMVSSTYFSLNSSLFLAKSDGSVKQVPFIRSKALFGVEDGKSSPFFSLRGRISSFCPGFHGAARDVWMELFLKYNRGYIKKSRCSISRGLGYPLPKHVLQTANLWDRECAYLSLPIEKPPPPPFSEWAHPPVGYELAYSSEKYKYSKSEKVSLRRAFSDAAWEAPRQVEEYEKEVQGFSIPEMNSKKFSRLAGITFSEVRSILSEHRDKIYSQYLASRTKRYQYWKPSSLRKGRGGPPEVHQVDEEPKSSILYPPPSVLYGMCPPCDYKPRGLGKEWLKRRVDVVEFTESIVCRDGEGLVIPRNELNDVYLFWE